MSVRLSNNDRKWAWNTLARMKDKYEKAGYDYETLSKYIVYLEPKLPVPYEEAYRDLLEWREALYVLGKSKIRGRTRTLLEEL